MTRSPVVARLAAGIALAYAALCCGTPILAAADLAFETAAIHPADKVYPWQLGPTTFHVQSTVRGLVMFAYDLKDYQVIGGPAWAASSTDLYDIQAKTDFPASADQIRQMVASLLRDRF